MTEVLSLWRSPLDQVALSLAQSLRDAQPRCSIGLGEDFHAMTIFNYGYYLSQSGATPDSALTAMFSAMNPGPYATGGIAFIPQVLLPSSVKASTYGFTVPDQCNVIGSGPGGAGEAGGTPYYHFTIDFSAGSRFLGCNGDYTAGGKYFCGLAFFGTKATSPEDTCIFAETENCRAVNCTFTNIPTAFNAQGIGCALEQCTIYYDGISGTPTAPVKAVIIAGAQCEVIGPGEIFQQPQQPGAGGPTNCTAISVEAAQYTVIADIHLSDWNIGVDLRRPSGPSKPSCEIAKSNAGSPP